MIIRRKPVGFDNLRKPQSLGMNLLRNGVSRLQALTIRRVPQSDEPIDWGDGVPDDIYSTETDTSAVDESFVDMGGGNDAIELAARRAEATRPGNAPARANRSVQRQPAAPPTAKPAQPAQSAAPLRRQSLSEGDTMPSDLKAIYRMHKDLGHWDGGVREEEWKTMPSRLFPETPAADTRNSGSRPAAAQSNSPGSNVQRTPDAASDDAPPRPRRRAKIVDLTPPLKGLPFGDETTLPGGSATSQSSVTSSSPLGAPLVDAPVQRTPAPETANPIAPMAAQAANDVPEWDTFTDSPSDDFAPAASFDAGATLPEIDMNSLRADSSTGNAAENLNFGAPAHPAPSNIQRTPDVSPTGYDSRPVDNRAAMPRTDAGREPHTRSFESNGYADADDEAGAAAGTADFLPGVSESVQRTVADFDSVDPRASVIQDAIRRAESPTFEVGDSPAPVQPRSTPPTRANTAVSTSMSSSGVQRQTTAQSDTDGTPSNVQRALRDDSEIHLADTIEPETAFTVASDDGVSDAPTDYAAPTSRAESTIQRSAAESPNESISNDSRQDAIQRAIARAEAPTVYDAPDDQPTFEADQTAARSTEAATSTPRISSQASTPNVQTTRSGTNPVSRLIDRITRGRSAQSAPDVSDQQSAISQPTDSYQNAVQRDISRVEAPISGQHYEMTDRVDSYQDESYEVPDNMVQRSVVTTQPSAVSNQQSDMSDGSTDSYQDAVQRAIARAESPTVSDIPNSTMQRSAVSNQQPPINDATDNYQDVVQRAVAHAESPTSIQPSDVSRQQYAATDSAGNYQDASYDTPDNNVVQRSAISKQPVETNAPANSYQEATYNAPDSVLRRSAISPQSIETNEATDAYQDAVQRAIARAEAPTSGQLLDTTDSADSVVQRSAVSNQQPPINDATDNYQDVVQRTIARAEAAVSEDITPLAETDAQNDVPTRSQFVVGTTPASSASVNSRQPHNIYSGQQTEISDAPDSYQDAVQRAIARAEAPTIYDDTPDTTMRRSALSGQQTQTNNEVHRTSRPSADSKPGSTSTVQRNTTAYPAQPDESTADIADTTAFASPYATDDLRNDAFTQAIARAEARTDSASRVQRTSQAGTNTQTNESFAEQPVDILTALAQMGAFSEPSFDQPAGRANSGYSTPAQPQVQRTYNVDAPDAALRGSASSSEADLLRLMGLPADTPIERGASLSGDNPSNEANGSTATQNTVQRASEGIDDAAPAVSNDIASSNPEQTGDDPAEIEKMAQAVYRILRQRLKVERERSQGRSR